MMTSTSEISGKASSGMRRNTQMPASTRKSVPVKTKKRLRVHQSIHRAITLHPSCCADRHLLAGDGLPVFPRKDRHLPRSAALKLAGTFVDARSLLGECYLRPHRGHSHFWHPSHEKCHANFCPGDWCTLCIRDFHAKDVAALVRRTRIGGQLHIRLRSIHRRSRARTGRGRNEGTKGSLKLAF